MICRRDAGSTLLERHPEVSGGVLPRRETHCQRRKSNTTSLLSFPRIEGLLDQLHWRLATHARSGRDRPDRADIAVIIELRDHTVADRFYCRHVKDLGFRQ